jgi:site-specific recombinase XerD
MKRDVRGVGEDDYVVYKRFRQQRKSATHGIIGLIGDHKMNITAAVNLCLLAAGNEVARATVRTFKVALKSFVFFLGTQKIPPTALLEEIKVEHFIYYPGYLSASGKAKSTIRVYANGAKYFMDWLVIRGDIRFTYDDTIRYHKAMQKIHRKREALLPRTPKPGVVERLIQAARIMDIDSPIQERNAAIIEFLASSGCRVAEVAGMLIKDIDLIDRSAIVTGKGQKERRVFFSSDAADAIREYWKVRGYAEKSHPVFTRHDPAVGKKIKPLTTRSLLNIVDLVMMMAGVEKGTFTPHYFRHAFATLMLHETKNLALVQDALGHSDPRSTRVYAKINADEIKEAHREVFE